MSKTYFQQSDFSVRFEWGLEGLLALRSISDLIIIVDVLSFSTCVDIATSRGAVVLPYKFKDETVEEFAIANNAIAAHRTRSADHYSLSPRSLLNIAQGYRFVLPSPNGAMLSLMSMEKPTATGCLRNASAVAGYASAFNSVGVIACGERWEHNGTMRPSLEDMIGAGAIISKLTKSKSPEALAAQVVFQYFSNDLNTQLSECASGIELIQRDDTEDVVLASELDVSDTVPIINNGEYRKFTDFDSTERHRTKKRAEQMAAA